MLTVGQLLKQERENKNISLKEVEKKIKVREKYLRALENNDWDYFASKVYVNGIIKNYAHFLELDSNRILAFFRRDYEKKEDVRFKKRISSGYLTPQTKRFALIGIIVTFIFFLLYFGYQFLGFILPPRIEILQPKIERFRNEDRIRIIGKTQKESAVSIFSERVFPNKDGLFEYDFPLKKGKNTLVIEVTGGNGKKTVFKRDYFREK